uniref:Dolichyl-diphosphooligosaccharide--protein glycosyltransferase 48 kDa subunit n=1 Tax=Panagrellus redivivus TaxID=6233 RepID=A0A7E4VUX7_PANRE
MLKLAAALLLLVAVAQTAPAKNRVLVLLESPAAKQTYSIFLKSLETRGYVLTVKRAEDANLQLFKYGEFVYDHLVIFAPSVQEFGGSLSVAEITNFVDAGGNVLFAGGAKLGDAIRELASESGYEFDDDSTSLIDHHNYDATVDSGDHTAVLVDPKHLTKASVIIGNKAAITAPILYRGSALVANPKNNLKLDVLTAATTSYSFAPNKVVNEYPSAIGRSAVLVGALQARNNARVVVTGSVELFSDAFINANVQKVGSAAKPVKSGNGPFVDALSQWAFQEKGVLRVKSVNHHLVGESAPPRDYTITEDVEYSIEIEELKDGKWVPYTGKDVQLEFVRIDPFVRTFLKPSNGKLTTVFKLPDVYGVFKFLVDYHRLGYSHLYDVQQVSVRPLLHTQYERFIRSAFPYYVSSFSMMIGVVLFSCVFLYHKEAPKAVSTETKKAK